MVDVNCWAKLVASDVWKALVMFTFENDVYSYGMLYYEYLTGRRPSFEGASSRYYDVVPGGNRSDSGVEGDWILRCLIKCIEMCMRVKSGKRPTFSNIVEILKAER